MNELIASRKAQRAMLSHQLELYKSGEMHTGSDKFGNMSEEDAKRIEAQIAELDTLLGEHKRD